MTRPNAPFTHVEIFLNVVVVVSTQEGHFRPSLLNIHLSGIEVNNDSNKPQTRRRKDIYVAKLK